MSSPRFSRFVLRTLDVAAATEFYEAVIGGTGDWIVKLHEGAIARGARPHWLGHIDTTTIGGMEKIAAEFLARGATRFAPPGTGDFVVLRDPGGALVALWDGGAPSKTGVVWHHLNTADAQRAATNYTELFGWALTDRVDLGELGRNQQFAWREGERNVGSISDIDGRSGVHPHWTFFFGVGAFDRAIAVVMEKGGKVLGPMALPGGIRVAMCDDPQDAAFGLMEMK